MRAVVTSPATSVMVRKNKSAKGQLPFKTVLKMTITHT